MAGRTRTASRGARVLVPPVAGDVFVALRDFGAGAFFAGTDALRAGADVAVAVVRVAGAGFVVGRFAVRASPVVLLPITPPPSSTSTQQSPSRPRCQACRRRG